MPFQVCEVPYLIASGWPSEPANKIPELIWNIDRRLTGLRVFRSGDLGLVGIAKETDLGRRVDCASSRSHSFCSF